MPGLIKSSVFMKNQSRSLKHCIKERILMIKNTVTRNDRTNLVQELRAELIA